MAGLLRPEDLKMIASDAEMAEVEEEKQLRQKKKQQEGSFAKHSCRGMSRLKQSNASITPSASLRRTAIITYR